MPLSLEEARELTERIRSTAEQLWALLARAHAGRAWLALGYPSFEAYVREEFGISRSRAYQILDQAKVIQAIEAATPPGTSVHVTEAEARDIKPVLDSHVLPEISKRTQGLSTDEASAVVNDIIDEYRDRRREERSRHENGDPNPGPSVDEGSSGFPAEAQERDPVDLPDHTAGGSGELTHASAGDGDTDTQPDSVDDELLLPPLPGGLGDPEAYRLMQAVYDLYMSLVTLSAMPAAGEVADAIPADRRNKITEVLPAAMEWLTAFRDVWTGKAEQVEDEGSDSNTTSTTDLDFDDDF